MSPANYNGPANVSRAEGDLDLRAVGSAIWRRKRLILGMTVLAGLLAFAVVNFMTPKYKSEARVLLESRENVFLRPEAEKNAERSSGPDQEMVTSQVQLVMSRDLAREVIDELKLGEKVEFDPLRGGPSLVSIVLHLIGLSRDPASMTAEERVLDSYYKKLNAYAIEKTRVIAIEFQSASPELAAKVANTIAAHYLSRLQSSRQDQTRAAGDFLLGEIEKMRSRVADAEGKVEAFRAKSNLLMGANNTTLSTQQLSEFNSQLSAARAQKSDAEVRARLIRDMLRSGRPIESSDVINSELIRRLSEQRVTLQAQLAEQSSTLLSGHPRIKELKAQIGDLDQQLRNEAQKLARILENDAKLADARVDAIRANLDQLKHQAASTSGEDVQLRQLDREAKAQRDLLESYLAKYREASARDNVAATPAEARIISRAVVSNLPAFPKKLPIIAIASLAAFFLMTGFVTTSALIGDEVYRPAVAAPLARAEAVAWTPTPISAIEQARPWVPRTVAPSIMPSIIAPSQADSAVDSVTSAVRGATGRPLAVIGIARNIGTTLSAIALARRLAQDGTVVLVDFAFASPNLSVISSDPDAPGIAEGIRGTANFGEIITRDRFSRVHLVATGTPDGDERAMLASAQLAGTLAALERSYDYVLIDAGAMTDAAIEIVAQLAPYAIMIVPSMDDPAVSSSRDRLLSVGFTDVTVMTGQPGRADAAA